MDQHKQIITYAKDLIIQLGLYDCLTVEMDLPTLFVFRYLLDQSNDIVNLNKDVHDLQYFPERLHASYRDEWRVYCKKILVKLSLKNMTSKQRLFLTSAPQAGFDLKALTERKENDAVDNGVESLTALKERFNDIHQNTEFTQLLKQVCVTENVLSDKDITIFKSEQQRKIEGLIK